jgi:hypothetical protein
MPFNENHPPQSQGDGLTRSEADALAAGKVPNSVPLPGLNRLRTGRRPSERDQARRASAGLTSFHSVLFPEPNVLPEVPTTPDFFHDLNSDQVVSFLAAGGREYDPASVFYSRQSDLDAISWRHLGEYVGSTSFSQLATQAREGLANLSAICYRLLIKDSSITVRPCDGEAGCTALLEKTFEKFRQDTVADYRTKVADMAGLALKGARPVVHTTDFQQ